MSAMDPKKPEPRKRGRPEKPLVHPHDVQDVLDRLRGPKLKAEPEPGEKPEAKPKAGKAQGKRKRKG